MRSSRLSVVLVEPWYGGSHRAWADGLAAHSRHDVRLVTHEDAHWRWRLRGSARTLADLVIADVEAHGRPDVVLVSSMTDAAQLLGFARGALAGVPAVLYLHESQIAYPTSALPGARPDPLNGANGANGEQPTWTNWASMTAVDRVVVNSRHHLDALRAELPGLLAGVPDRSHVDPLDHLDGVLDAVEVLPVGVELDALMAMPRPADDAVHEDGPLVVWNQRWDHDKDPEALFRVLRALAREGHAFRLALAGENRRLDPQEFVRTCNDLGERVVHVGHLPRDGYLELLGRGDVVVSTARHEFFGVAVVEAIAAGLVPLLPDRLSYPELVPDRWHDACLYGARLYDRLAAILDDLPAARRRVDGLRGSMARWSWPEVAPRYDAMLEAAAEADRSAAGRPARRAR